MVELVAVLGALVAAVAYRVAVAVSGRRGRDWSRRRTGLWLAGLAAALLGTVGPLAEAGHHHFEAHVVAHLLVVMLAPLLLVLAAPVTLALRTLTVPSARALSRVLGARVVRVLTEPVVAGVLDLGGLWVFYRTGWFGAAQHSDLVHLLSHTHMFVAGTLFTVSLVGVDPMAHRRPLGHRVAVLVLAAAAHGILAKTIYAAAPLGVSVAAAQRGSMIMYYGGDGIELVLLLVLGATWWRSRGRLSYPARSRSASRSRGLPRGRSGP